MPSSLAPYLTTPSFVVLDVFVTHGSDRTPPTSLLLAPPLVFFLATPLHRVLTSVLILPLFVSTHPVMSNLSSPSSRLLPISLIWIVLPLTRYLTGVPLSLLPATDTSSMVTLATPPANPILPVHECNTHISHFSPTNTTPTTSPPTSSTTSQLTLSIPEPTVLAGPSGTFLPHVIITRSKRNIHRPITKLNLTAQLTTSPTLKPTSVTQAIKDPKWRQAMSDEFDALVRNGTWELVPSHPTQNLVGCKWIFLTKYLSDDSIDSYKARLVAKGFHQ